LILKVETETIVSSRVQSVECTVLLLQDHEGNSWKTELLGDQRQLTVSVDKSPYHYQHNRTKILIMSAILVSRDPQRAPDVAMKGHPVHGYFSNFIDGKGYLMTFPVQLAHVSTARAPTCTDCTAS